jgi:hypothetical protein
MVSMVTRYPFEALNGNLRVSGNWRIWRKKLRDQKEKSEDNKEEDKKKEMKVKKKNE